MMMAIREELDNPHKPKTWDVFRESLKVELRSLPFQQLPQSWLWMFCVYSYNLGLIRWRKKALDILQTPSLSYSRMSWLVLLLLDEEEKCGNGDYLTIWTMNYIGANSRISTMLWSSEHSKNNYILSKPELSGDTVEGKQIALFIWQTARCSYTMKSHVKYWLCIENPKPLPKLIWIARRFTNDGKLDECHKI